MDDKRITELIKQLSVPDVEQRRLAAELLGRSHHYRALIPLQNALLDPDAQVRYRAAKGLVWIAGISKGIKLIAHTDPEVRQGAIWAVDELRRGEESQALIQALVQAMDDPDGGTRAAATYVLGHLGGTQALEPLLKALDDDHRLTRMNAVDALGKLGDGRAVPVLIEHLADQEAPRYLISEALGKLGDARALPVLKKLLGDEDTFVQEAAVNSLIALEGPDTALDLLASEVENIRTTAALWLTQQPEEVLYSQVPRILALLQQPPADLDLPLIRILAQARNPQGLPRLVNFLRHPRVELRRATLHALQRLAQPQAMLPVLLATKDHDPEVRVLALRVLESLETIRQLGHP
ncbi:HEAT repeat domain-containing protein [Anthocerotibacter panamensis]|uniref:HEAT repeat domain-containing protein n=1 Tax=Anthocerotibacter panamensis TaxID=2857077 RepID=UPI001C402A4B|nr:HEAT repeat domain-containing protein [Anthocerotibacter panamensis]